MNLYGEGISPSKLVRIFWILQGFVALKVFESLLLRHYIKNEDIDNHKMKLNFDFWFEFIGLIISFFLLLRSIFMKPKFGNAMSNDVTTEENANISNWLTFGWLNDTLKTGYERPLNLEDLHYLRNFDRTKV